MALQSGTQYKWDKESIFNLNNEQFGKLYNGLSAIVSSPVFAEEANKARQVKTIIDLHAVMNEVLGEAVEAGIARPIELDQNEGAA